VVDEETGDVVIHGFRPETYEGAYNAIGQGTGYSIEWAEGDREIKSWNPRSELLHDEGVRGSPPKGWPLRSRAGGSRNFARHRVSMVGAPKGNRDRRSSREEKVG
jgi:hypothetical protein